jgi:hypothetical protein
MQSPKDLTLKRKIAQYLRNISCNALSKRLANMEFRAEIQTPQELLGYQCPRLLLMGRKKPASTLSENSQY